MGDFQVKVLNPPPNFRVGGEESEVLGVAFAPSLGLPHIFTCSKDFEEHQVI